MKTGIVIFLGLLTTFFTVGAVGEKDNYKQRTLMIGTVGMAAILAAFYKLG